MNNQVHFKELKIKNGDKVSIEKIDSHIFGETEVVNLTDSTIEFIAPRFDTGGTINFKTGETVNIHYWTSEGNKFVFSSIIQNSRTAEGTHSVLKPEYAKYDGARRWTRYKPINMLATFLNKSHTSKINDIVHIGRVANISAGGMLLSTPKRFNVGDNLGLGFYIKEKFFTAVGVVKSCETSKITIGEMEIALQFANYSDRDKEYLEAILSTL